MIVFPPTVILRHRRENLKKCSLRGLEPRSDLLFFTYPRQTSMIIPLSNYLLLDIGAPPLSKKDKSLGLLLLDGTWRYAEQMHRVLFSKHLLRRSIPSDFTTAYPRRQEDCSDPERGLASVEALFIAYFLIGRDPTGLLDHYHWKNDFLKKNRVLDLFP